MEESGIRSALIQPRNGPGHPGLGRSRKALRCPPQWSLKLVQLRAHLTFGGKGQVGFWDYGSEINKPRRELPHEDLGDLLVSFQWELGLSEVGFSTPTCLCKTKTCHFQLMTCSFGGRFCTKMGLHF